MSIPTSGTPEVTSTQLMNGDYAVIKLKGVKDGDIAWLKTEEQNKLKQEMMKASGEDSFSLLLENARKDAEIIVNSELQ